MERRPAQFESAIFHLWTDRRGRTRRKLPELKEMDKDRNLDVDKRNDVEKAIEAGGGGYVEKDRRGWREKKKTIRRSVCVFLIRNGEKETTVVMVPTL